MRLLFCPYTACRLCFTFQQSRYTLPSFFYSLIAFANFCLLLLIWLHEMLIWLHQLQLLVSSCFDRISASRWKENIRTCVLTSFTREWRLQKNNSLQESLLARKPFSWRNCMHFWFSFDFLILCFIKLTPFSKFAIETVIMDNFVTGQSIIKNSPNRIKYFSDSDVFPS